MWSRLPRSEAGDGRALHRGRGPRQDVTVTVAPGSACTRLAAATVAGQQSSPSCDHGRRQGSRRMPEIKSRGRKSLLLCHLSYQPSGWRGLEPPTHGREVSVVCAPSTRRERFPRPTTATGFSTKEGTVTFAPESRAQPTRGNIRVARRFRASTSDPPHTRDQGRTRRSRVRTAGLRRPLTREVAVSIAPGMRRERVSRDQSGDGGWPLRTKVTLATGRHRQRRRRDSNPRLPVMSGSSRCLRTGRCPTHGKGPHPHRQAKIRTDKVRGNLIGHALPDHSLRAGRGGQRAWR